MDQMLKQRLIGAIVIISLAVIFIPMILEGPDDKLSRRTQEMPPPPKIDYQTEVALPVPAESTEAPPTPAPIATEQEVSAIPETPAPATEAAAKQPETPVKPPVVAPAKHPGSAAKPPETVASAKTPKSALSKPSPPSAPAKSAAEPAPAAGAWIVQVGSFGQQPNATSLRDRLKKSGYPAYVQEVKSAEGHAYRVVIGPESDHGAAERLRDKLARELQLKGMVVQNK